MASVVSKILRLAELVISYKKSKRRSHSRAFGLVRLHSFCNTFF